MHILNISSDKTVATTREMILRQHGYQVLTALDLTDVERACRESEIDLAILGHSLNRSQRERVLQVLQSHCKGAPVLDIDRKLLDPSELLAAIERTREDNRPPND